MKDSKSSEQLTLVDLDVILESLMYSKRNIEDAHGTPQTVRKENADRVDTVVAKIRKLKKSVD